MKFLFIDHDCHRKTHSTEFFLDIISRSFRVVEHYYKNYYDTESEKAMADCDGAIVFEFPISRKRFFFPGKVNVFIPMYDNEWGSFWQWRRIAWSGMGVISFCEKISAHAKRCGVKNLLDVRYFPDPSVLPQDEGDRKRVFLWERGEIDNNVTGRLFPAKDGWTFDVKATEDFMPRNEYLRRLSKCGVVIAPRYKEGIGMTFLEAMAMRKCVIANNDATMNEYIKDGETGILFTRGSECPVDETVVSAIHKNLADVSASYRERWLMDVERIDVFLSKQKPCRPSFLKRLSIAFAYPMFLAEGAWHRIWQMIREFMQ